MINFIFSTRWIINSILSAILGYKLVWLTLTFNQVPMSHTVYSSVTSSTQMTQQPIATTASYDLTTLLNTQLFGNPQEKIISTQSNLTPPPKTRLNLKLHGIYYSTNPNASIALIAEEKKETKLYKKGDVLPGSSVLYQIYPKQVILLRNKRQETLLLVESDSEQKISLTKERVSSVSSPILDQTSQSPEQLLGEYQQQLRTNPQKLRNLLNATPYSQDGKFVGYRLRPGKNATLMSTFNLQAGDILTEVNGVVFDSPLKGLEIIQQLATAQQVSATVLRNGQPVSLSFTIEK